MIVERVQVADTKKIIELAKKGFPVTSLNARYMVKYLTDFEAANKHYLKEQLTVRGFGWKHYAKQDFFVLGNRVIGTDINVFHLPESIGDEKYSKALIPDGTKERWLETIKKLVPYDKLMYTLYAGFVPIIAEIIECPNFINDMWGETSVGKTTSLELAASIYGLPVREQGGLVMPWDATKVSIERLATLFNHLPIFLDDSQTTNDKVISPALYMMG